MCAETGAVAVGEGKHEAVKAKGKQDRESPLGGSE